MSFKKSVATISAILFISMFLASCGNNKTIGAETYQTYGLFNKEDCRNPDIEYRLIIGNVIWAVILCETIIAPIYFFGFSLYEPIHKKIDSQPKGSIRH